MKVKFLEGTSVRGVHHDADTVADIELDDAAHCIGAGRAVKFRPEPEPPTPAEPTPEPEAPAKGKKAKSE